MWGIAFDIEIRIRHLPTPCIQQEISRMRFSTLCKLENHYDNDKLQTPRCDESSSTLDLKELSVHSTILENGIRLFA